MNKVNVVEFLASLCLLMGSIMNLVELFVDVHRSISIIATLLILISAILWFIAIKRRKSSKQ